jgi:parvulin-like peptidyl-prolyl isomerase
MPKHYRNNGQCVQTDSDEFENRRNSAHLLMLPRLRPVLIALGIVLFACTGASCGSSNQHVLPENAVAVVGHQVIQKPAVTAFLTAIRATDKQHEIIFPEQGTGAYLAIRDQAIGYFVRASEIEQRARETLGIEVSAKQVAASIAQIRIQTFAGSNTKMRERMRVFGWSEQLLQSNQRLRLTEQAITNKLAASIKISPDEARTYYDQHAEAYRKPQRRTIRDILLKQKSYAETLYTQVKSGADFAKVARQYLDDSISRDQGDEFTISRGETVASFENVVFALTTGQLSRPVHTKYGWYLIQAVTPPLPAEVTPFSRARTSINRQLLLEKQRSVLNNWRTTATRYFCQDGRISYQAAYRPVTDKCITAALSPPPLG